MRNRVHIVKTASVMLLLAVVVGAAVAYARGPIPGGPIGGPIKECPNKNIYCLDVWDPVTCDNGVTYSNQCYADRACATGCEPGGARF